MARPKAVDSLTIAELQALLHARRSEVPKLRKQRARLLKELSELDRKLSKMDGRGRGRKRGRKPGRGPGRPKGSGAGRKRPRNTKSLVEVIKEVLGRHGAPMKVGEVLDGVRSAGYRSSSGNFRGIVNQTLIKEKAFHSVGRGTYALKKG
jgi:hypothetical protein